MTAEQVVAGKAHQKQLRVGDAHAEMGAQRVDFFRCERRLLGVAAFRNTKRPTTCLRRSMSNGFLPLFS